MVKTKINHKIIDKYKLIKDDAERNAVKNLINNNKDLEKDYIYKKIILRSILIAQAGPFQNKAYLSAVAGIYLDQKPKGFFIICDVFKEIYITDSNNNIIGKIDGLDLDVYQGLKNENVNIKTTNEFEEMFDSNYLFGEKYPELAEKVYRYLHTSLNISTIDTIEK